MTKFRVCLLDLPKWTAGLGQALAQVVDKEWGERLHFYYFFGAGSFSDIATASRSVRTVTRI